MSEMASSRQTIWQRLIEPHPSIVDFRRRRRTTLLAALSLGLAVVIGILALFIVFGTDLAFRVDAWSPIVLLLAAYVMSRTRWPEVGSFLITFGQLATAFIFLYEMPNPVVTPQAIIFLLLPVLFSMLVLTALWTLVLSLTAAIGLTGFVIATPWLTFNDVIVPYSATVILTVLAAAAAFIRERDVMAVEEQTNKADRVSRALEADMRRISAVSEVGRTITGTRDLNVLLDQVVNLIVQQFDFYHAQVFLVDEVGQYALLRASTGDAGEKLLARGHKLAVGSQSVIGQVTARGATVTAADTDVDAVHRRNELLPLTRSEMALPLRVGGRVIGALDVQSTEPDAFHPEDVSIFQSMADQLAIAIENARLFDQARRDLQDIERLNRQLTGEAWRDYMGGRRPDAPAGFKAGEGPIEPMRVDDQAGDEKALSVPLKVRGQTIGLLDIAARDGSEPDEETRQMLEAVAERVALALDSSRLSEQAQRQAAREQILGRLSAELQATTDLDVILRIAAREASRALDTPHSFVHLTMSYSQPEDQVAGGED